MEVAEQRIAEVNRLVDLCYRPPEGSYGGSFAGDARSSFTSSLGSDDEAFLEAVLEEEGAQPTSLRQASEGIAVQRLSPVAVDSIGSVQLFIEQQQSHLQNDMDAVTSTVLSITALQKRVLDVKSSFLKHGSGGVVEAQLLSIEASAAMLASTLSKTNDCLERGRTAEGLIAQKLTAYQSIFDETCNILAHFQQLEPILGNCASHIESLERVQLSSSPCSYRTC